MAAPSSMTRREFLRFAMLGASGAVLAACGASGGTTENVPDGPNTASTQAPAQIADAVTISFWHIWGGDRTAQLDEVLDDFMADNPRIKVEPLLMPNPGYSDKIIPALAGDAPDLTMIYTDEFAPSAQRGALLGIDDWIARDGLAPEEWYSGQWDMTQVNNQAFGLPFAGNFLSLIFWSKDDFTTLGRDPERGPETWDDLLTIASDLTERNDDGTLKKLGYVPQAAAEWMHATYRNGHDWYGNATPEQIAINHPRSLEALEFVVDIYNRMGGWDTVGATMQMFQNSQLGNPLIAGVASSISSAVFTVNIINQQAPDLNYKIGRVPHGPNGRFLDLTQGAWTNSIPAKARHPEQAWELAKYLSVGDGHRKFMVDMQGRPTMLKKYNEDPYAAQAREQNPYWDEVLEILNGEHVSLPVSEKLRSAQATITEAFESTMLEQRTPKEAVDWAQAEVVRIFETS